MARGTAAEAAAKWATNTVSAVSNGYLMDGVRAYAADNPNLSPSAKAAQNQTFWLSQVTKSAQKWATNSQAVTTQDWVNAMNTKAVANIPGGVTAAQTRFQGFMTQLLAYIGNDQQIQAALPQRTGTIDGGIARATAWIRHMHNFQPTGTR